MNWIGGARSRVTCKGEKKIQKEFFEKQRLKAKTEKRFRHSPPRHSYANSQDIKALYTLSKTCAPSISGRKAAVKPARFIDLNKSAVKYPNHVVEKDLGPCSPIEFPSRLILMDSKYERDQKANMEGKNVFEKSASTYLGRNDGLKITPDYDKCRFSKLEDKVSRGEKLMDPLKALKSTPITNFRKPISLQDRYKLLVHEDFQSTPLQKYDSGVSHGGGYCRTPKQCSVKYHPGKHTPFTPMIDLKPPQKIPREAQDLDLLDHPTKKAKKTHSLEDCEIYPKNLAFNMLMTSTPCKMSAEVRNDANWTDLSPITEYSEKKDKFSIFDSVVGNARYSCHQAYHGELLQTENKEFLTPLVSSKDNTSVLPSKQHVRENTIQSIHTSDDAPELYDISLSQPIKTIENCKFPYTQESESETCNFPLKNESVYNFSKILETRSESLDDEIVDSFDVDECRKYKPHLMKGFSQGNDGEVLNVSCETRTNNNITRNDFTTSESFIDTPTKAHNCSKELFMNNPTDSISSDNHQISPVKISEPSNTTPSLKTHLPHGSKTIKLYTPSNQDQNSDLYNVTSKKQLYAEESKDKSISGDNSGKRGWEVEEVMAEVFALNEEEENCLEDFSQHLIHQKTIQEVIDEEDTLGTRINSGTLLNDSSSSYAESCFSHQKKIHVKDKPDTELSCNEECQHCNSDVNTAKEMSLYVENDLRLTKGSDTNHDNFQNEQIENRDLNDEEMRLTNYKECDSKSEAEKDRDITDVKLLNETCLEKKESIDDEYCINMQNKTMIDVNDHSSGPSCTVSLDNRTSCKTSSPETVKQEVSHSSVGVQTECEGRMTLQHNSVATQTENRSCTVSTGTSPLISTHHFTDFHGNCTIRIEKDAVLSTEANTGIDGDVEKYSMGKYSLRSKTRSLEK